MPDHAEQTLIEWLRDAGRVMAFCGAGVSAESGLPTFRGAGGLWEGHRVEDVATPEAFARDPLLVWRFYAARQEALQRVEPNPAHRALAEMEARYPDFLLVTQNVDDLHERAGSRTMIKIHGSLMRVRCTACRAETELDAPIRSAGLNEASLPRCACGGLLRPGVVWFGEMLNPEHLERVDTFFRHCPAPLGSGPAEKRSLLLVIGTSGMVSSGLFVTRMARTLGARSVEINPNPSELSGQVDLVLRAPAGELLGRVWPRVFRDEAR